MRPSGARRARRRQRGSRHRHMLPSPDRDPDTVLSCLALRRGIPGTPHRCPGFKGRLARWHFSRPAARRRAPSALAVLPSGFSCCSAVSRTATDSMPRPKAAKAPAAPAEEQGEEHGCCSASGSPQLGCKGCRGAAAGCPLRRSRHCATRFSVPLQRRLPRRLPQRRRRRMVQHQPRRSATTTRACACRWVLRRCCRAAGGRVHVTARGCTSLRPCPFVHCSR